jgi:NADH-quinone oxidoreductase subunit E
MTDVPAKNTPQLGGWIMGAGFGAVAFGVSYLAMGLSGMGAALVAAIIFLVTGAILGLSRIEPQRSFGAGMPMQDAVAPAPAPAAAPAVAAPLMAAAPAVAAPLMAAAPAEAAPPAAPSRPQGLATARGGGADDLKIIKGIGPKLEELCHRLGYYHFDQIAAWTPAEVAWVDDNLEGFRGRVTRDRWVPQAQAIVSMGQEAFLRRLEAGESF